MITKDGIRVRLVTTQKTPHILTAFGHAFRGIKEFLISDRNGKLHAMAAVTTITAGALLRVSTMEWCILLLCIAAVISLEMINASIERLCDFVCRNFHPSIKFIKDVSAGAVLFASIASAVIGLIIFIPKIISLL